MQGIVLAGITVAAADPPEAVVFENGLRVLAAAPARPGDRAEVLLVVGAGTADEGPGQAGAAWITARASASGEVSTDLAAGRAVALHGARLDISVAERHTVFRASVPAERLGPFLDLLAALVGRSELPAGAWLEAAERRTRASRAEASDPWRQAGLLLDRALWGGAGAPSPGGVSVEELSAFRQARYRPEAMVLAVAAGLPHRQAIERASASFAALAAARPEPPRPEPERSRSGGGRAVECAQLAGLAPPVVLVGFGLEAGDEASFYGWQVLSHVLGGGHASRLHRRLRLEEGLAYTAEAAVEPRSGGRLVLRLASQSAAPERVRTVFLEEAARLAAEPVDARELKTAQAVLQSRLALSHAATGDRLLRRALAELGLGPGWDTAAERTALDALTAEALQRLAREGLRPERARSVVIAGQMPPLCTEAPPGRPAALLPLPPPLGLPAAPIPAGNPLTPAKVELGRRLFFDTRLSVDGTVSCASCHRPERAFADEGAVSTGVRGQTGSRNTPSLLNAAYAPRLFWDGRAIDLEDQIRYPITHPKEMSRRKEDVVAVAAGDPAYRDLFARAFGDPEATFERVGQALASFQRTLISAGSPFDRFFFGGEKAAVSAAALRGWELFRGRAGCIRCHQFDEQVPFFTDFAFHNTGVGWDRKELPDLGRYRATRDPADRGRFRTPSLRTAALTPPYMHDGSFGTLAEVVDFYASGGIPNRYLDERIQPIELTARERADLVAFIESLAGEVPAVAGGVPGIATPAQARQEEMP